jgi:hypothetical protein
MGHSIRVGVLGCWIAIACGCAATKRTQPFVEQDFARFAKGGRNALQGSITLQDMNTSIKGILDTGNTVELTPDTPYTTEWYDKQVLGGQNLEPADPRLKQYQRTANVAQNGDYQFDGLAPGNYYLTGSIRYCDPFRPSLVLEYDLHSQIKLDPPGRSGASPSTANAPQPFGSDRQGFRLSSQ